MLTLLLPQWKAQVVSCLSKGYCVRIHRLECTVRCYRPSHLMGSCHTHWKWTQLKEALIVSVLPHCQRSLRYGFPWEPDSCSELAISTEQISSWETNSSSAGQGIPRTLWNSKIHHRFHKVSPLVHILIPINSVHAFPLSFFKIHFNIVLPSALRSSSSSFPTKTLYTSLPSLTRFTCFAHLLDIPHLTFILANVWIYGVCIYIGVHMFVCMYVCMYARI